MGFSCKIAGLARSVRTHGHNYKRQNIGFLEQTQVCPNKQDWNTLITEAVKNGESRKALTLYQRIRPDASVCLQGYTIVALLKACSKVKDLEQGNQIHGDLKRHGLSERSGFIGSTLVDMYAKCGCLFKAQQVFDNLLVHDVVTWTNLISGYAENGLGVDALTYFKRMQLDGVLPDAVAYVSSLKACRDIRSLDNGQEIHHEIVQKGIECDVFLGSSMVDMYAKCGMLLEAQTVFYKLLERDRVLWTTLISAHVEHGHHQGALDCFEAMQRDGFSPGIVAFVCSSKACASLGCRNKGQEIHHEATMKGLEIDNVIGSTLVDMYAKCGLLAEAQLVFDKLNIHDVVPWTALISGYTEHGNGEQALKFFCKLKHADIFCDVGVYVCAIKACGSTGSTAKGREINLQVTKKGWEKELFVSSALVDMYAKCGSLKDSESVFETIPVKDVVLWTALITGYAQLGQFKNVFHTLDRMVEVGIKPDNVTFSSILNVCSQAGHIENSYVYFEVLIDKYGLIPSLEHYNSIIDLLCRAGHIEKAIGMIKKMPFHPGIVVWHTVLGHCQKWHDVKHAKYAFENVLRLDVTDTSAYVCMSNIYADASMEEEAKQIELLMLKNHEKRSVKTQKGC